jgi:hypothetical protein
VAVENFGQIYTSTDSGVTWTPRESARNWHSAASSADGVKLAAVELGGQIHTSSDSGVTWTPRESARDWRSVAASADGVKLVAGVGGGQIYTSGPGQVSPPVAAPLVGLASSGVSLVYAGSSQWMVVSQQGSLFQ